MRAQSDLPGASSHTTLGDVTRSSMVRQASSIPQVPVWSGEWVGAQVTDDEQVVCGIAFPDD
jgi:hypothetical protein